MNIDMDTQLKEYFRSEVAKRKEPKIFYGEQTPWRSVAMLVSRVLLAASAITVFWTTALLRQPSPLDTAIDLRQVEETVSTILQHGNHLMQAYLDEKKPL